MSEAPNSNYLPPKVTYAILGTGNTVDYIRADLVAGMREALKKASDIFLAMDCDCCSLTEDEECLRCYGMNSMAAALEAGKVDG